MAISEIHQLLEFYLHTGMEVGSNICEMLCVIDSVCFPASILRFFHSGVHCCGVTCCKYVYKKMPVPSRVAADGFCHSSAMGGAPVAPHFCQRAFVFFLFWILAVLSLWWNISVILSCLFLMACDLGPPSYDYWPSVYILAEESVQFFVPFLNRVCFLFVPF